MFTKIHLAVDANGMPVRVLITEGTRADCKEAIHLIDGLSAETLLADRGYDTNQIIAYAADAGMNIVIPAERNRKATALHYPRVWLYARTGSGHRSVAERQLKELREWATCNGYCVVGQSCECAKANSFWHPGLFSMLRAVRRGNVDTVAVTRLSRFAVHKSKLCYVLSVLQKNGVVIHTSNCQLKYDLYLHGLDRVLVG